MAVDPLGDWVQSAAPGQGSERGPRPPPPGGPGPVSCSVLSSQSRGHF